jgi:RNA polymerase sigma-70 factor (ECF subfamily)
MVASLLPSSHRQAPRLATDRTARAAVARQEALHDATLVRRFNAGDETAFSEIVARYRAKLLAVALGLLRNRADAEEIAQDALIRAHRGLVNFRGDSSLSAWLHCITLNLARNRYWYFYRRRRHATQSLDCAISADSSATYADLVASDLPDPVRVAATREFSVLVAACMEKLQSGQREILLQRNVRHHSYRDIARTLGIGIGTVKSRIGRARRDLRLMLVKTYPEFAPAASPAEWFDPVRPTGRHAALCA